MSNAQNFEEYIFRLNDKKNDKIKNQNDKWEKTKLTSSGCETKIISFG